MWSYWRNENLQLSKLKKAKLNHTSSETTFWWQTFSVLAMCMVQIYTCFEKEVSYYINSVTTCLYFLSHNTYFLPHNTFLFQKQDQIVSRFFFFSPARFFLSLTAYCGRSNQHRHLPALFGLLHIIKNTIIRMDQPAFTQSSWLKNITVWQWTALYNTSFLLDFLFRLGKLIQMRLLG